MHDWTDNDDQMMGSEGDDALSTRPLTPFRRMHSIDSVDSKSSSNHSTQYSSSAESAYLWARPTVSRLNSRTSGLSFTGNSIREEEEEEDQNRKEAAIADREQSDEENEPKLNDDIFEQIKSVLIIVRVIMMVILISLCQYSHDRTSSLATVRLISDERRQTGSISRTVYMSYFKSCSLFLSFVCLLLIMLTQVFKVLSDFWLANWSKSETRDDPNLDYFIKGYAFLSIITIVISLATNLSSQLTSLRAVRRIHATMLDTVVKCPIRFFDTTPIGRIVNRFSVDISVIDKVTC